MGQDGESMLKLLEIKRLKFRRELKNDCYCSQNKVDLQVWSKMDMEIYSLNILMSQNRYILVG